MKTIKNILLIALIFTIAIPLLGLAADNTPKIDKLISQMPVDNREKEHELDKELIALAPESFEVVCERVVPEGQGGVSARYALNSLVAYCSAEGRGKAKGMLEKTILDAVSKESNDEVKVFLIDQLRWIASGESLEVLAKLIADERLCDPAARVLTSLGSQKAEEVLIKALSAGQTPQQISIIKALGQLQSKKGAKLIRKYADTENSNLKDVSLFALANIGEKKDADLFQKAIQTESRYAKNTYASYYLLFAERLAENGDKDESLEICQNLFAKGGQINSGVQSAALSTMVEVQGVKAFPRLVYVMKTDNEFLQGTAMELARRFTGKKYMKIWGMLLPKVSEGAQLKIIRLMGESGGEYAEDALRSAVKGTEREVKIVATSALINIASGENVAFLLSEIKGMDLPSKKQIALYARLAPKAKSAEAKKMLIEVLGELDNMEALEMVAKLIDDADVSQEASLAAVEIALPEKPNAKPLTNPAVADILSRASQNIDSPKIRQAAMDLVAKVKEMHGLEKEIPSEIESEKAKLTEEEKKEGFKLLFNGVDLAGWQGNTKAHVPVNQMLKYEPALGGGNLYTDKEYEDFIFRFEFKLTPGANNGLGIRTPLKGDPAYAGMELQILDNTAPKYANLKPYQYHGSVYGIIPAELGRLRPVGQWNEQEVIVDGRDIKVILNGETIVDGNLDEASKGGTMDGKNHPGLKREKGYICFCSHGSLVYFRNIRIKELD